MPNGIDMDPWPGNGYTMKLYSTVVSAWDHTWTHSLLTYHNSIESVLVKGKACPFFASSPSAQVYGDTYAANKPVEIIIEAGVKTIDIETSGKIANCDGCYGTNIMTPVDDYEKYGISLITAPINSLIGVFLNNNNPSYYDTPSRLTNYGSYADNTPKLQQAFFIYHFYTSISSLSTIQVPEGATRLYLGGLDGYGWNDNTDNYSVKLTLANSGCTTYSGTLSTEQMEQQPNGTYYLSNASGTHKGILSGPSGMDFDLRLYKWNGTYWDVAGKGITLSSNETVSVYGSAGYYT